MGSHRLIALTSTAGQIEAVKDKCDAVQVPPNQLAGWNIRNMVAFVCTPSDSVMVKATAVIEAFKDGAAEVVVAMDTIEPELAGSQMATIAAARKGMVWFELTRISCSIPRAAEMIEQIPVGCGLWTPTEYLVKLADICEVPAIWEIDDIDESVHCNAFAVTKLPEQKKTDKLTITSTELDL